MPQEGRLARGEALGRYRLESVLGTGGMASVWKAHDERLGRTVAVKVMSETLALDRDFVTRFRREAKVAAGLSHPNLVTVFDFNADGPRPYLVSEYIEGGTLADRVESGERVDAETLARQLLEALAHIHGAGVIHRDVKPANVLIDREGRSRLTDFGVAQPRGATQMTEAGKVLGTLAYMAPEVRAGGKANERSDLYSAGMLLDEVVPAAAPLRSLTTRLSAEDPGSRPASAQSALAMLEAGSGETALAGTAVLPRTERRPVADRTATTRLLGGGPGRRRAVVALAALLLLAAGLALAGSLGGGDGGGAGGTGTAAAPASGAPQVPAASDSCAALEQNQALADEHGPGAAHDKAPKDQLKQEQEALRDQLKACGKAGE